MPVNHTRVLFVCMGNICRSPSAEAVRRELARLHDLAPAGSAGRARLFLEFAGERVRRDVPDPYYGEAADFELVLDLLESASRRLLQQLTTSR